MAEVEKEMIGADAYQAGREDKAAEILEALVRERFAEKP
jgi:hypothetical protein